MYPQPSPATGYLSCQQLLDFLSDYVEGELPAGVVAEFDRHLQVCPACVAYLSSFQRTITLAKECAASGCAPPPNSVPDELVKAVTAALAKPDEHRAS